MQLSTLAHVDTLVCYQRVFNVDGLDAWAAQMTGLTFLELHIRWWPDCLNNLTSLQHLVSLLRVLGWMDGAVSLAAGSAACIRHCLG